MNGNNNLHFNLTEFSSFQFSKFKPGGIISYGNVTNWELHTILNNSNALLRATFYRKLEGKYITVSTPFK